MSRIYFHTPEEDVAVHGSERAHFGVFCENLAWSLIDYYALGSSPKILQLFPKSHYAHNGVTEKSIEVAFKHARSELKIGDRAIDPFSLSLNTALKLGNDAVKFAARVHGQCEIHCWTRGENRAWLANIIQQGWDCGFYRGNAGWGEVIQLLRSDDKTPCVLSYSVCEQFPNRAIAGCYYDDKEDEDGEKWYEMPESEQWQLAMMGLEMDHAKLELKPDGWDDYFFMDGYTAMDLAKDLSEL